MHKRRVGQREWAISVLWSEFLVLWFDRTRRRVLPLLLATLLLLIPSLPARANCSCEPGEHHHQEVPCHDGDEHEKGEAHEHEHSFHTRAVATSASTRTGRVQLLAGSRLTVSRAQIACCSCTRAPVSVAVVAVPVASGFHADSQSLTFVRVNAHAVFCFDVLSGVFGRAGPAPDGKPQLVFLASLAGRAPPVSL